MFKVPDEDGVQVQEAAEEIVHCRVSQSAAVAPAILISTQHLDARRDNWMAIPQVDRWVGFFATLLNQLVKKMSTKKKFFQLIESVVMLWFLIGK